MDPNAICIIVPASDYIHVLCAKCESVCKVDYKGIALSVPQLQFKCPECGDLGTWKLENDGPGFTKHSE
jgi:phage FluMu protein Com